MLSVHHQQQQHHHCATAKLDPISCSLRLLYLSPLSSLGSAVFGAACRAGAVQALVLALALRSKLHFSKLIEMEIS